MTPLAPPLLWSRFRSALKFSTHQTLRERSTDLSLGRRLFRTSNSTQTLKANSFVPKNIIGPAPPHAIKQYGGQRIRTLDPSKLTEDDYIDFSLKSQSSLGIILQPGWPTDLPVPRAPRRNAMFSGYLWSSNRFPVGTHGFMYYHVHPNGSPLAGELRFRITSSRNPTSFATGTDLLTERSMPWRYPLYKIVCRPSCRDMVALLLQDGLVSPRTLDLVTATVAPLRGAGTHMPATGSTRRGGAGPPDGVRHPSRLSSTPVLSAFGQEFDFRFVADLNFCGVFASADAILTHYMRHLTAFRVCVEGRYIHYCPFEGSVVCCFERSTLPEHAGRRVVVIRIKRFIKGDPIREVPFPKPGLSDGRAHLVEELRPREGELLKAVKWSGQVGPWAGDVDKQWRGNGSRMYAEVTPWKALRVLFENEELYGSPRESS